MKANDHQVGGTHYKTAYEHWDLVVATGMGYFPGQATRYIARWRKKDGIEGLQKALHYIDKMLEITDLDDFDYPREGYDPEVTKEVERFAEINELSPLENAAILHLAQLDTSSDLQGARAFVIQLLVQASAPPVPGAVPASDSNKHADRVECLVSEGRAVDFAGNSVTDCRYPNCNCKPEDTSK